MRRLFFGLAIGLATLAPTASWGGDREVAQQIANNLKTSGQLQGYKIGVKVNGNVAELGGTVRDEQQMTNAMYIAKNTTGVDNVVNNLTIVRQNDDSPLDKLRHAQMSDKAATAPAVAAPAMPALSMPALPTLPALPVPPPEVPAPVATAPAMPVPVQQAEYAQPNNPTKMAAKVNNSALAARMPNTIQNTQARPINQQTAAAMQQCPAPMQHYGAMNGVGPGTGPIPAYVPGTGGGVAPASYDHPYMPNYAWPSYASYPNYAALTYPRQYSPTAWPYIGPFYPYPQVPMGWRKVSLEWEDGWWFLDFCDDHKPNCHHCGCGCK